MHQKIRLADLSLDDLQIHRFLEGYQVSFDKNKTVGDIIYEYLNSKNGLIQHKRHVPVSARMEDVYREAFRNIVSKGSPIVIFISSFSPKITNPSITNHQLLPNMSDLLTLVHLHLLAKHVRSFYDYGFRFVIGFKGNLYKSVLKWDEETVKTTYSILQNLTKHAERITGTRNAIEWTDVMELVDTEGDYFYAQWNEEIQNVQRLYMEKDAFTERKINGWIKDYIKSINPSLYAHETDIHSHMREEAFRLRAFKHIQYSGGEKGYGICNSLPPNLRTSIRGIDPSISLQINPYFRYHPHQRLILLNEQEAKWEAFSWDDEKDRIEPVWCEELEYPFYYRLKNKSFPL